MAVFFKIHVVTNYFKTEDWLVLEELSDNSELHVEDDRIFDGRIVNEILASVTNDACEIWDSVKKEFGFWAIEANIWVIVSRFIDCENAEFFEFV